MVTHRLRVKGRTSTSQESSQSWWSMHSAGLTVAGYSATDSWPTAREIPLLLPGRPDKHISGRSVPAVVALSHQAKRSVETFAVPRDSEIYDADRMVWSRPRRKQGSRSPSPDPSTFLQESSLLVTAARGARRVGSYSDGQRT